MLIKVLTSKHHFSSVFYNRMFDEIRQSRDALKPDSKSTNKVHELFVILFVLLIVVVQSYYLKSFSIETFVMSFE